jgi:hypothetical protein
MDTEAVEAYPVAVEWESFGVAETPADYVFHRPRLYLETTIPSFLKLLRFAGTKAIRHRFCAPLNNY